MISRFKIWRNLVEFILILVSVKKDGWMAGWLDGWMAGWLDGWMAGWLDGWGVRCLASQPTIKPSSNQTV